MYAYAVLIYPNITIDDEVVRDVIARATIDQKRTACCLVHDIAAAIADRAEMIILLVRRKHGRIIYIIYRYLVVAHNANDQRRTK